MVVWTEEGFGSSSNKADSMREAQEGQCRFAMRKVIEFVTVEVPLLQYEYSRH